MSNFRTISLWQPWATLCVLGEKRYETRSWSTPFKGTLLIHATAKFDQEWRDLCREEPFRSALARHGYTDPGQLPTGAIVGKVRLVDCLEMRAGEDWSPVGGQELAFGDWQVGRYAWWLTDPERFARPIPARGHQQIWTWEGELPAGS